MKEKKNTTFHLGVAGYTYCGFTLDQTLAALARYDIHGLCAKDKHFPMKATPAELRDLVRQCRDRGVTVYGAGPISIGTEDEAKRAFDYAATLGVKTLVGVPWKPSASGDSTWSKRCASRELCEFCSGLCATHDIRFAIHNHGRNPKTGCPALYGAPVDTWSFVKDLDRRMGLCMDVAYTFADGFDPAQVIRDYAARLFDLHLRNVSDPTNGSSGAPAHLGRIDYVAVMQALKDVGYTGWCGLELANAFAKSSSVNPGANPVWIPLSLGYFRGIMDTIA